MRRKRRRSRTELSSTKLNQCVEVEAVEEQYYEEEFERYMCGITIDEGEERLKQLHVKQNLNPN